MTFQQIQEWWIDFEIHTLQGIPRSVPGPLAIGKKENKPAKKEIDNRVKYTTGGMPYKEIEPSGCEVSAWKILNNKQDKGSTALSDNELTAARQKGFAVDTIIQVKRFWAAGHKQIDIARMAGVALSTVKSLTPIFKKAQKQV